MFISDGPFAPCTRPCCAETQLRARSRDWQQPLFLLWLAPATAAMLVLGFVGKLRGWW